MKKPTIVIDVERMKYKNIGLYTFCEQLILNLKGPFAYRYFGNINNVKAIKPTIFHKIFGVFERDVALWHATHQDVKYLPFRKVPMVLTIHDLNFLYTDKSEKKKQKRLAKVQKLVDRASSVVVISNYVLEDVKKHIALKEKPIQVIYNGTQIVNYDISKLQIKEENFLFTLGTVVPKKNFHVLLSLLVATNYKLLIAGVTSDASYVELIKLEADRLGVADQLKILGPVTEEEKQWYYTNCKAFLFPSLSEGFGLPVMEAMRYGKPVFCSNLTSLPEIGGQESYYFESFSQEHMLEVFQRGMKDYELDANKKERIIAWSEKFTWAQAAKEYEGVYASVLKTTNQRG